MFIWCHLPGTDESGLAYPHEVRLLIKVHYTMRPALFWCLFRPSQHAHSARRAQRMRLSVFSLWPAPRPLLKHSLKMYANWHYCVGPCVMAMAIFQLLRIPYQTGTTRHATHSSAQSRAAWACSCSVVIIAVLYIPILFLLLILIPFLIVFTILLGPAQHT